MNKYEKSTKDSERENFTATAHRRAATGMEVRKDDLLLDESIVKSAHKPKVHDPFYS